MGLGKEFKKVSEQLVLVTQLGLTMIGSICFCFFIGYKLDQWLHTKALFLVIFIILGIIGGGYTVYRQILAVGDTDQPKAQHGKGDTPERRK